MNNLFPRNLPLYLRIKGQILQMLEEGQYPVGAPLPSERQLAKTFGVSLVTVRAAIAELDHQGIVRRQHGRGTFVAASARRLNTRLEDLAPFPELIRENGFEPGLDLLRIVVEPAGERVAKALSLEPGDPVCRVERRYLASGKPVIFITDWLPRRHLSALPDPKTFDGNLLDFMARETSLGLDYVYAEVHAEPTPAEIAQALDIPCGAPVLFLEQFGRGIHQVPVLYSHGYNRSDLIALGVVRKIRRIHDLGASNPIPD